MRSLLVIGLSLFCLAARRPDPDERQRGRAKALECEYSVLSEAQMRAQLLNLMGEADQVLDSNDYGSAAAKEMAMKIRGLANQLILKTSSNDKLGLEGFMFAGEIDPPTRRRR